MLEIKEEIVNVLGNDTTIQTLLGGTDSENRIYSWNPSEDILYSYESNLIGAVFFRLYGTDDRPYRWSYPSQMPNLYIHFRVKSLNELVMNQVTERIIELFDIQTIETDNWRFPSIQLTTYNDGPIEGTPSVPLYVQNIVFICRNILRK